ncbi:MAG: hypothetical protein ACYTXA_09785 [Nostoc sp.]
MPNTSLLRLRQRLLYETLRVACFHEVVRQAQGNAPLSTLLYETLRVACFHEVVRQAQGRQSQYKCPMPNALLKA